jgi:hypothetical protein
MDRLTMLRELRDLATAVLELEKLKHYAEQTAYDRMESLANRLAQDGALLERVVRLSA